MTFFHYYYYYAFSVDGVCLWVARMEEKLFLSVLLINNRLSFYICLKFLYSNRFLNISHSFSFPHLERTHTTLVFRQNILNEKKNSQKKRRKNPIFVSSVPFSAITWNVMVWNDWIRYSWCWYYNTERQNYIVLHLDPSIVCKLLGQYKKMLNECCFIYF